MEHTDALVFLREQTKRLNAVTRRVELQSMRRLMSSRREDLTEDQLVVQELRQLSQLTMQAFLAEVECRTRSATRRLGDGRKKKPAEAG